MLNLEQIVLGIVLVVAGLAFYLVVRLLLAVAARSRPAFQPAVPAGAGLLSEHSDAVLVIEAGGRIRSINSRARQIFHLQDNDIPHLERLSRKVRPNDALMNLCAAEGQARFVLEGRLVEGTSYRMENNANGPVLIILRQSEMANTPGGLNTQTLQTFTQLSQGIAASLDLEETLQAILANVEKLIPAEFMEVTIWDPDGEDFIPYRFLGVPGAERRLERATQRYPLHSSLVGRMLKEREPYLISDLDASQENRQVAEREQIPLRSYLGLPLLVGNEFIGTLSLGALSADVFRSEDLDLVRLLSGQAAVAVHNALLYQHERLRTAELSGLAQLTQAFSSVRDPNGVFARLVESIAPLVPVEILGFLMYNENQRILEARAPFHGLPEPIVAIYRTKIVAGSPAEQILVDQDVLITDNASLDEKWALLGMDYLAQAASLRETVLVPLNTAGHMLGYLQASNHIGESQPFTQAELHLLMIIANQTASIIENASLVQQSRQRAQRAEALRRITSLASSAATLDEILQFSLQELARLLRADVGAVFLMNPEHALLQLHRPSIFLSSADGADSPAPLLPHRLAHVLIDDPQFHFTVAGSQHALTLAHYSEGGQAIIPFYQTILENWKIESLIAVPLVVRNDGIGELWFASRAADFFDQGDVQVVSTAAGQLAGVVEQSFLRSQTDESLRRRVEQMTAITRISRELSTSLDLNYLLKLVYAEALRTTSADCGTIMLFHLDLDSGVASHQMRFFVGDEPPDSLTLLEQIALDQDAPQVVSDFNRSEFQPPHFGIQSALVVPISWQQQHGGLIYLHGKSLNQFDATAAEITQSLAVQASVALNNALAFEEQSRRGELLKRELETFSQFIEVSRRLRSVQTLDQSLTAIAGSIQSATPFDVVLISVFDAESQTLRRTAQAGLTAETWQAARMHSAPWRVVEQLCQPEYRLGEAYYIPENKTPAVPEDVHLIQVLSTSTEEAEDSWHQYDMLLIPLFLSDGQPLGLISVDAPRNNRRPDRPAFDTLDLFAIQTAQTIEHTARVKNLENSVSELAADKNRLALAAVQAQSNLPVLLHKELEQSIALHGLNQRIERVRTSLEIAAQANRQETKDAVLNTLASELLTRFAMQVALIAEDAPGGIRLVKVVGTIPAGANPEALFGQRNPLRQMLVAKTVGGKASDSSLVLVSSLENAGEWQNNNMLNALEARSMIGLVLDVGADQRAAVLVLGQRPLAPFLEEDRRVFAQLAYQVSIGLQNLELLTETRRRLQEVNLLLDFSRKLGSLSPADIFSSLVLSVAQVVPNAKAGWVGMWEEQEMVIAPQAAMGYASVQDILGLRFALQSSSGEIMDTRVVVPLRVFRTGRPERVGEVDFASNYHLSSEDLMRYRRATNGRLPLSAMFIPLRIGENVLGVVCFESFENQDAFSEEDEALAYSFTGQAAMALENARLYQASEQRATQLQALTMVAGTITSSLQRDELIALLLDQLKIVVPYDTATLWLRQGSALTVAAATGFTDSEMRLNLSVAVEDSQLFRLMILTTEPISVGDLRNDQRFPSLVEPDHLSWLGIPLIFKSAVMGVIALEKHEADYYKDEIIQAATTYAGQAAVSLENARLFEESLRRAAELDERSQRLALLNRLSADLVSSLDVTHITNLAGQQLIGALHASGVTALMLDAQGRCILQTETPNRNESLPQFLPPTPLFERLRESQGMFLTDNVAGEADLEPLQEGFLKPRQVFALMVAPLNSGSALQGWYLIYTTQEYHFNASEIELARTICNQAAIAIQNARLFVETRRLTEDLERRVEDRTHELRREHQNSQTLLHIITELSTSLDMGMVLNRTLTVLNESIGSEESLIVISQTTNQYRAGLVLDSMAQGGQPAEKQIARWITRARQPVILARVQDDSRWQITPECEPAYQSVLGVPLVMGEEVLGALLLFHRQPDYFSQDLLNLLEATARQIAIALNNAELFNLIRDQSEHLGSMLREQQIEASRSRAILEAVADGVLVTNAQGGINLFNASAERILDLKSAQVSGKSLDQFVGLFGRSAGDWMQTIRNFSQNLVAQKEALAYAEQIDLDNGRIVAVRLAPVYWRQEFLGTVSTFRDITHEVQVDRLKSEFVANVSHELRTPMTSIKGYVEIMLMGAAGTLNPQQVHFLSIVKSNTERLSVLVNDLLDVSRIEAGRVTLNFQPLDLREIAEDVIADLQRRAREENKPMHFNLDIPRGLPFAMGDVERVRQVLSNLVCNGFLYTPENGCVAVHITEVGKDIQVDVEDNGIGIEEEEQKRIFERFYRGEDPLVLASAGTGLGLAIARTLIEMNKGRIWFQSSGVRGEGSTFSFTLPVQETIEE